MGGAHRSTGSDQSGRLSDVQFRRLLDDLKQQVRVSGVVGKAVKLKKVGREYKGLCPFHNERTPSFTVVDELEWAHCFGCGWHGDIFRFVMDKQGCSFKEAYRLIANDDLPTWTPAERAVAQAEERLERLADEQDARKFFKEGVPVAGTDGEVYLRARGIVIDMPDTVRFGMIPSWRNKETKEWGRKRPALMFGAEDLTGAIVGIQRIFFPGDDARLGKADCKLSLGSIRGSVCRLGPAEETIILPEAPEDGASIMQEGPGFPVWIPFGTSMMPQVLFPPIVKRVIIARQNNTAGRVASNKAAIALVNRGLEVGYAAPAEEFDDWNDQLRARRR